MKDQEKTENMEEPRIDKTIYTGRPENTEGEHRGPSGEGNRSVRFSGQSGN